jgi:hypothetical protein
VSYFCCNRAAPACNIIETVVVYLLEEYTRRPQSSQLFLHERGKETEKRREERGSRQETSGLGGRQLPMQAVRHATETEWQLMLFNIVFR